MLTRYRLLATQWLPYSVPQVFRFFADPANLPPLMPAWQGARIEEQTLVDPPGRPEWHQGLTAAGKGSRVVLSFLPVPLSPVRMRWVARIAEFGWDQSFCDQQESGPFAFWLHCHRVREGTRNGEQGTLVTDDVRYSMKFGLLGDAANLFGGAWSMRALFAFRHRRTRELLAQGR
jgi:ligand-binding SRPBCC domain-containing protein